MTQDAKQLAREAALMVANLLDIACDPESPHKYGTCPVEFCAYCHRIKEGHRFLGDMYHATKN